ncbi:hypothetical protein PRIC1_011707 [Phytophthora ramorum]
MMRVGYVLLVTLLASTGAEPATVHVGQPTSPKIAIRDLVDSVAAAPSNADDGRRLRAHRLVNGETEVGTARDEERTNLDPKAEKWLASLLTKSDAHLAGLARAPKGIDVEKVLEQLISTSTAGFKTLVRDGVTPDSMFVSHGIEKKLREMTKSQLTRDADVQTYLRFKDFWDTLPKKVTSA